MRLLSDSDRIAVMTQVRKILAQSRFDFQRADVISGTEEGVSKQNRKKFSQNTTWSKVYIFLAFWVAHSQLFKWHA